MLNKLFRRKITAFFLVMAMVFGSSAHVVFAYGDYADGLDQEHQEEITDVTYHEYQEEGEYIYIDLYDLDILGIIDEETFLEMLLQEGEYVLEEFLELSSQMEAQLPALEAYSILMDEFFTNVNGYWTLVFPDNYAGAFVDNNILVIQLTDISAESTAFYRNLLGSDAAITFQQVEFSLNQLISFGEIFVDVLDDSLIVGHGFDTLSNSYLIYLDLNIADSVQIADNFIETARLLPIPIAIELREPVERFSLLTGGRALTRTGRTEPFSVGITGARFGVNAPAALLTTGHAFRGVSAGTEVRQSGITIGTLAVARDGQHVNIGNPGTIHGDWAIINLNATGAQNVTNLLGTGHRITAWMESPPVGTILRGTGSQTLNWQGTVSRVNFNLGFTTGLTAVRTSGNNTPRHGDSGGTIFASGVTGGAPHFFVGVLAGGDDRSVIDHHWWFSPYIWARNLFAPRMTP